MQGVRRGQWPPEDEVMAGALMSQILPDVVGSCGAARKEAAGT